MLANKNNHLIKQILKKSRKTGGKEETDQNVDPTKVDPEVDEAESDSEAPIIIESKPEEESPIQAEYPDTKYLYRNIQNLNYPSTKTYVCAFHLANNFVKYIVEAKDAKVEFPSFEFENIQKGGFLDDDIESGDLDVTFQNNVIEFVQTFFTDASVLAVASIPEEEVSPESEGPLPDEGSAQNSFGEEEGSPSGKGENPMQESFGEEEGSPPGEEEGSPSGNGENPVRNSFGEEEGSPSGDEKFASGDEESASEPEPPIEEASPPDEETSVNKTPLAKGGSLERAREEGQALTEGDGQATTEEDGQAISNGDEAIREGEEPIREGDETIREGEEPIREGDEPIREGDETKAEGEEAKAEEDGQAIKEGEQDAATEEETTNVFAVAEKPEYIGFVKGKESSIYVFVKISSDYNLKPEYKNSILNELFHTNKVFDMDVDESVRTLFENNTWLLDDKEPYSGYSCKFADDGQLANVKEDENDAGELINVDSIGDYYYFSFLPIDKENAKEYKRFAIFPNEYVCIHNANQMAEYKENKSEYAEDKSIYFKDTEGREFFAVKTPSQFIKE
jgi:hypothetical protein